MIINGYIDYTFRNRTNIPSTILCNNHFLNKNKLIRIAKNIDINIREGIYTWTLGPSYETPSEVDDIITLGGHAVGMSTIPEIIKAQELNIPILGVSCLTNYAAGLVEGHLTHHDVVSVAKSIRNKFSQFINEVI